MQNIKKFGRNVLSYIPNSGYDAWSKHRDVFNIITTAACNGGCNDCHTAKWMEIHKGYDLSLFDLQKFLEVSKESGYHFKLLSLSGGDPSLWSNLVPGMKMIKESGLFDRICAVTNVIAYDRFEPVIDDLDYLRVSQYLGNEEEVKQAKKKYGIKVDVIDQTKRHVPPTTHIEGSLPARCHCEGWSLTEDRIWVCNAAETLVTMLGFDMKEYRKWSTPVQPGWLEKLASLDFYRMPICMYCIGNDKVYKKTPIVPCVIGSR